MSQQEKPAAQKTAGKVAVRTKQPYASIELTNHWKFGVEPVEVPADEVDDIKEAARVQGSLRGLIFEEVKES